MRRTGLAPVCSIACSSSDPILSDPIAVRYRGILNLCKPSGVTSRDVVNRVARLVRPEKVGHAGTLDPLATGVLLVGVGSGTRLLEYLQRLPKQYFGTFLLGRSSPTEDVDGPVTELVSPPRPTQAEILAAAARLIGRIQQRPPAFSALKIAGRRAYDLARAGQPVNLKPREVEIHQIHVARYDYPLLELDIQCGSGTYVRSLGRDLAQMLGTEAVMSALVRRAIGGFRIEEAFDPEQLTGDHLPLALWPELKALEQLPQLELWPEEALSARQGKRLTDRWNCSAEEAVAVDQQRRLVAILTRQPDGHWHPGKTFPPPDA